MTRVALEALREGRTAKICNKKASVFGPMNKLFVAMFYDMYKVWKEGNKTIGDFAYVIKDLSLKAKKSPGDLIAAFDNRHKKPKTGKASSKSQDVENIKFTDINTIT
jgi:hypothetical protein